MARNIRSIPAFVRGLWDWTFLNKCFASTNIRVSDVDGLVERYGHFLVFESKPERYTGDYTVKLGQRITHKQLCRTGVFTVIVVWGTTDTDMSHEDLRNGDTSAMLCSLGVPSPTYYRIFYEDGRSKEGEIDRTGLQDVVGGWFKWAAETPAVLASQESYNQHRN